MISDAILLLTLFAMTSARKLVQKEIKVKQDVWQIGHEPPICKNLLLSMFLLHGVATGNVTIYLQYHPKPMSHLLGIDSLDTLHLIFLMNNMHALLLSLLPVWHWKAYTEIMKPV